MNLIRHSTVLLIAALYTFAAAAQTGEFNLPDFGDPSASAISPLNEKRLGKKLMAQARSAFPYVVDPEIDDYLTGLGNKLVANSDMRGEKFHFYLIERPQINAFAIPGGYISLNTGLIAKTKTESELAGVLAHEITHVTQRHLPRMIARQKELTLPAAAAILGGILIGGQAGAAAIVGSNAGLIGDQLSYTRDFEREADAFGIRILAQSGFDPNGMPDFFTTLQQSTRLLDSSAPEFLRTHPLTVNRISDSQNRAAKYATGPVPSSPAYYYMREKIRALAENNRPDRVAESFAARLDQADAKLKKYVQYGYAYALMENKQYDKAAGIARRLRDQQPDQPYLDNLLAQIQASAGEFSQAVAVMDKAVQRHPRNAALRTDYADILIKAGKAKQSEPILRKLIQEDKENSFLYRLYARATGELGNMYESHRALGGILLSQGQLQSLAGSHAPGQKQCRGQFLQPGRRRGADQGDSTGKNPV